MVDKTLLSVKYETAKRKITDNLKKGYNFGKELVEGHEDEYAKAVGGLIILGAAKYIDYRHHCRYYDHSMNCYVPLRKNPNHLSKKELQYMCKRMSEGAKKHDIYEELGLLR